MAIKLADDTARRLISSIKMLDFFLEEIGPSIYNKAIADAQAHTHDRVGDLDGVCYEPEYGYWKR